MTILIVSYVIWKNNIAKRLLKHSMRQKSVKFNEMQIDNFIAVVAISINYWQSNGNLLHSSTCRSVLFI